ncbi:hypothetical protein BDV10DRAFT_139393 [Aspergillus recurvatus]
MERPTLTLEYLTETDSQWRCAGLLRPAHHVTARGRPCDLELHYFATRSQPRPHAHCPQIPKSNSRLQAPTPTPHGTIQDGSAGCLFLVRRRFTLLAPPSSSVSCRPGMTAAMTAAAVTPRQLPALSSSSNELCELRTHRSWSLVLHTPGCHAMLPLKPRITIMIRNWTPDRTLRPRFLPDHLGYTLSDLMSWLSAR